MGAKKIDILSESNLKLVYSSDKDPGFTRKKTKKKLIYLNEKREELRNPKILQHIENLAIPPMWENVWICPLTHGHLQSTGRDAKRRKQYVYHPEWVKYRQTQKFSKLIDFVDALPILRETTAQHLKNKTWNRQKVLALIIKVLDNNYIRIGNEQYAKRNQTYGLTTLRRKHLDMDDDGLTFSYKAKSNKYRNVKIDNKRLAKLIKECSELRGYEVFRYKDSAGFMQDIDSSDVNDYIHEIMGNQFSAKDFRTWAGTSLAVDYFADAQKIIADNPRKKLEPALVKMVAKELGNTMSVCREYYIHPAVLDLVKKEEIPLKTRKKIKGLDKHEVIAKQILTNC